MSDTPPPRSNVALIISLCLNLILAGVIAMALARFVMHGPIFDQGGPRDALGPSPERAQLHQALSPRMLMHVAPDKADQIHALLRAHRARIEELRAASMTARRHALEVFGAPNFDKASFERALAQMQAADSAFESEILKVVSETALTLTPEERRKAAAWRGRRGEGHGMRWRHDRGEGRDEPPPGPQAPPPGPPPPQQ